MVTFWTILCQSASTTSTFCTRLILALLPKTSLHPMQIICRAGLWPQEISTVTDTMIYCTEAAVVPPLCFQMSLETVTQKLLPENTFFPKGRILLTSTMTGT